MRDESLLASWARGEDAALWKIDDDRLGVLTVDFITPVVDDPRRYGEIAAANSLSDVWAMGGRPIIALNVVCFPTDCEPIATLREILMGGAAKAAEAGAMLAGGHSVRCAEPKYGMVVFGEVSSSRAWRTSGARDGDALVLTKPIGTGIAATAIKAGLLSESDAAAASESMATLNDIRRAVGDDLLSCVRAATDVTGFALAGHAQDMAGDDLDIELDLRAIPILPGVRDAANMGLIPAGAYANKERYGANVDIKIGGADGVFASDIMFDPQTSGGLLLAVDPDASDELAARARARFPHAAVIGRFRHGRGMIEVRSR